jgi:hypothetical protein
MGPLAAARTLTGQFLTDLKKIPEESFGTWRNCGRAVFQLADIHGVGQVAGGKIPLERARQQDARRQDCAGAAEVRAEPEAAVLRRTWRAQRVWLRRTRNF